MKQEIKNVFAACSTSNNYYNSKSEAIDRFDSRLRAYGYQLHPDETMFAFEGDFGRRTISVVNDKGKVVGYARFSWHLYDTGRYEFIGYLGAIT